MDILLYIIIFIMGTVFGSFFTLATYRIPRNQDITHTHSYCPNCSHKLGFLDLIPVFSYIFLLGKCRYCKEKISPRYLIIEILSGVTFALVAAVLGVIVLSCSDVITGIFRVILGIWIIVSGIRNFQTSLVWKEVKSGLWTITVLCALLMIIAGIVILVSSTLAIRIVGITIVIYAVLDIIARLIFMKKVQDYLDK